MTHAASTVSRLRPPFTRNANLLQIEPFASLVNTVRSTVPRLLLNRHAVGPFERVPLRRGDHVELGDLGVTVRRFAEMLGWNREIEELMSAHERQVGAAGALVAAFC